MAEYVCIIDGWSRKLTDERIVRCRDCEWFDFDICACKRRPLHMAVEPDGFCKWGAPKEVDA